MWRPDASDYNNGINTPYLDLPRESAPLQWWYLNAHLRDIKEGKEFSFFSSFFIQNRKYYVSKMDGSSYACTWALIDIKDEKYYADSLLDKMAPSILTEHFKSSVREVNEVSIDNVFLEMTKKGRLPRPDRVMKNEAICGKESLIINYDDESIILGEGNANERSYKLYHYNPKRDIVVKLEFFARTNPFLHGENGYVKEMFYYYYPSMAVKGEIRIGDYVAEVEGDGWYDREFGGSDDRAGAFAYDKWLWFSLHLSNGCQLSIFNLCDSNNDEVTENFLILTNNGEKKTCSDFIIQKSNIWTSLVTFSDYPLCFHIEIPSFELSFDIQASFKHQEFITILTYGGFYEGRVAGGGVHCGEPITIIGFHEHKEERSGQTAAKILSVVGKYVRSTLTEYYPLQCDSEWISKKILRRYCTGKGVLPETLCNTLFRPVRAIIDRGGKAWRSLVLVSCCNALACDYFDCTKYIAISELLHVGSLIIDDIQDESFLRRGGKTAHLLYGTPTAINAGTACYFFSFMFADICELPVAKAKLIYDIYFDFMATGHVGQGLDIYGIYDLMPEVVLTGNTETLFDALQAIHTYKTACVAAAMCRIACILCDVSEEITTAMENFGLGIGLAFQIVDDALNVKGFEGNLKEAGEDIRDGKITYPVAKAMGRLDLPQRERIWTILQEHTSDCEKVKEVVDLLNSVNAIDDCLVEAQKIVDEKWEVIDALLEDSLPKLFMRAFTLHITKRNF